jgi:hypothetical protein
MLISSLQVRMSRCEIAYIRIADRHDHAAPFTPRC